MGKKRRIKDPYAEREAEKYDNPIPSREFILDYLLQRGRPASRDELFTTLDLHSAEQAEALRRRLRAMERDGQLYFDRRSGYGLVSEMDLIQGRVISHRDGYGFLVPDDGSDDIFLPANQMRTVFHDDRLLVGINDIDKRGRREGVLVKVLERSVEHLVGCFFVDSGIGFVIPNNKHIHQTILIPTDKQAEAKPGQMVMLQILSSPGRRQQAIGEIIELLGDSFDDPAAQITMAKRTHGIPDQWPETVLAEAAEIPGSIDPIMLKGRKDLRELPFVTIDGTDAKDFDDAVYCETKRGGGWRLYVAIADVSHYVKIGSALDLEASQRGNSVYFPNHVIPMLPEALSNGVCSLLPHQDRLVMVCEMTIAASGKINRYRFYSAVIHSHARLIYEDVAKMLASGEHELSAEVFKNLLALDALHSCLLQQRETRGAIDFEFTETKIIFDDKGTIKDIVASERNIAHRIIEECMLAANVCAAKFLLKHEIPTLFRIHDGPNPDKLTDLREFLQGLGLSLKGGAKPKPAHYAELLKSIADRADANLIQTVLLRSLSQAVYGPENEGHFGLAYDAYGHFTSPIRRFPDLLVHRAIQHVTQHGEARDFHYTEKQIFSYGEHCSMTERRADEATRDVQDWLKCEFVLDKIGTEFDGLITSVLGFGMFVQLQTIYVEGLVHISTLRDDYYNFDPIKHCLQGKRCGRRFALGDKLRVRVSNVNMDSKKIDLELVTCDEN